MMGSPKTLARVAGVFYLLMFAFSFFAGFARNNIIVAGDGAATASNIRASTMLFRAGVLSDLLQITCFLLAYMTLYMLLSHFNQLAAAAMVVFTAISVGIYSFNVFNLVSAMNIATDKTYTQFFGTTGANQLTGLYTSAYANDYLISSIFFGLLLLPLGYLVIKSGYFHVVLGALLILAGIGYIADTFARALLAGYGTGITILLIPGALGEALLTLWLLVFGIRLPKPASRFSTVQRPQPTA
jgi:Domain of unknown function (DUF4386)